MTNFEKMLIAMSADDLAQMILYNPFINTCKHCDEGVYGDCDFQCLEHIKKRLQSETIS